MDCVFDRRYSVMGEQLPVKLDYSKIIFVMEDVDAACKVVLKRKKDKDGGDSGDGQEEEDDDDEDDGGASASTLAGEDVS